MLRIGICDDLADARLVLRSLLERILEGRKVQGQFFEFSSGETLLRWYDHHAGELDVIFLDMELHELDGMETARRLRAADAGLQLVFVTGYADHVFDGYSVGALGYLMKPPKQEQLEAVLDRAQGALVRELDRAYICRNGDAYYRVPISKILYFASDRRQVQCVTEGRTYTFYLCQIGCGGSRGRGRVRQGTSAIPGSRRGCGPNRERRGHPAKWGAAACQPLLSAIRPVGLGASGTGGVIVGNSTLEYLVLWTLVD